MEYTILIPNLTSITYAMYKNVISKYRLSIVCVIIKDSRLETDTSYISDITELNVHIDYVNFRDYESHIIALLSSMRFLYIAPVFLDIHQHLFGYPAFLKSDIYNDLKAHDIKTPEIFDVCSASFPLIAKPRNGSGSLGVFKISSNKELLEFLENPPFNYIELGKGYQYEEFIDGHAASIVCMQSVDGPVLIAVYDLVCDNNTFAVTERHYPSIFEDALLNSIWDNLSSYITSVSKIGGIVTMDIVFSNNSFYVIDVGNRLPVTDFTKHLLVEFADRHVDFILSLVDYRDIKLPSSLHQQYFIDNYIDNSAKYNKVIEYVEAASPFEKIWNTKALYMRGYVIWE